MESFSMTRLDIGWVTHAQKPEFALSTYSRKFDTVDAGSGWKMEKSRGD
jgi:hypothetical protein